MSARTINCPSCGTPFVASDRFCEGCGARLADSGGDARPHTEIDLGLAAGVSDRGLVHERNEDALFVACNQGQTLLVICDGVSSSIEPHAAAQVAADVAGRALATALRGRHDNGTTAASGWDPRAVTLAAIDAAQQAVVAVPAALEHPDDPPACTFVSALWDGETLTCGSVGDSRIYWIGDEGAHRITDDDAVAGSHMLTRWLGADAPLEQPRITTFRPSGPGHVIGCSDGLWNYAAGAEALAALVASGPHHDSPIAVAQNLTRAALAAGGHDNITVAVMTIDPDSASHSPEREQP